MGSISFKYSKPVNYAYAPGFASAGKTGLPGLVGLNGSTLFLIDHDLNNSYEVDLALQKIENNFMLNDNTTGLSMKRKYTVNDLLLANNGNCYKLIYPNGPSQYTFDIEYIGKITRKETHNIAEKFNSLHVYVSIDEEKQTGLPNHRQFISGPSPDEFYSVAEGYSVNDDVSTNTDVYTLRGLNMGFLTQFDSTNTELKGYDINVELCFPNKLSIEACAIEELPTEDHTEPVHNDLYKAVPIEKVLEFPCILSIELPEEFDMSNAAFVSEITLDMMHCDNQNFKCVVYGERTAKYTTAATYGELMQVNLAAGHYDKIVCAHDADPDGTHGGLHSHGELSMVRPLYNDAALSGATIENRTNWRYGEQAYFSGIHPDYVIDAMIDYVKTAEMRIIITNKENGDTNIIMPKTGDIDWHIDVSDIRYFINIESDITNGRVRATNDSDNEIYRAVQNTNINVHASPSNNYHFGEWKIINVSTLEVIEVENTENTSFQMPNSDVRISCSFEENVKYHLTVYFCENNTTTNVQAPKVYKLYAGESYTIEPVSIIGFTCNSDTITGTMGMQDSSIYFYYTRNTYTLTVYCTMNDDPETQIPGTPIVGQYGFKEPYTINLPTIQDYEAPPTIVGEMPPNDYDIHVEYKRINNI